jgi:hypothetical protein
MWRMGSFLKIKIQSSFLGLIYLTASIISLLAIVVWQSERSGVFGSGLMLGWDTSSYIALTKELLKNGEFGTMAAWSYPQLYVQLLAALGSALGNITMSERILPLFFGLLTVCSSFLISLRISRNIHIAGLSGLLQVFSISFLKIVSDNNRNLMALSLSFVVILIMDAAWKRQPRMRDYLILTVLTIAIAFTQFETFAILSLTLIISALLTRKTQQIITSSLIVAVPAALTVVAFPGFLLSYFQSPPILTGKQTLGLNDLSYWIGGSALTLAVFALGYAYSLRRWWRNGNSLSLLVLVWSTILLGIFFGVYLGLLPLQAEFGVRALLVVPSYLLISLGIMAVWTIILLPLRQRKWSLGRLGSTGLTKTITAILVVALLLANAAFGSSQSGVYFSPYISTVSYNKMVLATNYVRDQNGGVPIFVFDGSISYGTLYRTYIGELIGENFAYYGTLRNLLQLRPTVSNSSDPYLSESETSLSRTYFAEMSGNVTGPSAFIHSSYITNNSTLNSHTIVFITPELDNDVLPSKVTKFLIGNGIYVVPPNGLTNPQIAGATSTTTTLNGSPILSYPPTFDIISLLVVGSSFPVAISLFRYLRTKRGSPSDTPNAPTPMPESRSLGGVT